jgi:hyperosmotically inducible periplasmic protein
MNPRAEPVVAFWMAAPFGRVALALLCAIAGLSAACQPSDSVIRRDVQERLAANPATAGSQLSVDVQGGVVRLGGKTATLEDQQLAMSLARSVNGVKVVVNDMWSHNAPLAHRVQDALASDPLVGRVPIEVEAKGDTVRLTSDQTNQDQRARAVQIASAVEGVRQVEDLMK